MSVFLRESNVSERDLGIIQYYEKQRPTLLEYLIAWKEKTPRELCISGEEEHVPHVAVQTCPRFPGDFVTPDDVLRVRYLCQRGVASLACVWMHHARTQVNQIVLDRRSVEVPLKGVSTDNPWTGRSSSSSQACTRSSIAGRSMRCNETDRRVLAPLDRGLPRGNSSVNMEEPDQDLV